MTFDTGICPSYPVARIAATPGKFCDAIVTTNNGIAKLTIALNENIGITNTGNAGEKVTLDQAGSP